jgi:hypothetical protein
MQHPLSAKVGTKTSPTSGGRSVGIVSLLAKATEFVLFLFAFLFKKIL